MFNHIHHALAQVQELRARVLDHHLFSGYSARSRACGAVFALLGAAVLSLPFIPQTVYFHTCVWGVVCALGLCCNYGDVMLWYFRQPQERQEPGRLRPVIDGLPPLLVGGLLTGAAIHLDQHQLLFGIWMCLFGLTHLSSRHALPREIWWLGWYYVACGAVYLWNMDRYPFTNPWPMGLTFFVGEMAGAAVLRRLNRRITQ